MMNIINDRLLSFIGLRRESRTFAGDPSDEMR